MAVGSTMGRRQQAVDRRQNYKRAQEGVRRTCALSTRLVDVPMRVHMPPSIDAKESGMSST